MRKPTIKVTKKPASEVEAGDIIAVDGAIYTVYEILSSTVKEIMLGCMTHRDCLQDVFVVPTRTVLQYSRW